MGLKFASSKFTLLAISPIESITSVNASASPTIGFATPPMTLCAPKPEWKLSSGWSCFERKHATATSTHPTAVPFANPTRPFCLAPLIGTVIMPETPITVQKTTSCTGLVTSSVTRPNLFFFHRANCLCCATFCAEWRCWKCSSSVKTLTVSDMAWHWTTIVSKNENHWK